MKKLIFFVLGEACLLLSCANDPFDNPFDPASENYIPTLSSDKAIMIDDFNDGADPNLLGFASVVFKDLLNLAIIDVSHHSKAENVLRGVGYSIMINFNVSRTESGKQAFGGWVQVLSDGSRGVFNLAILKFDTLSFWVKAESPGIIFEVALKQFGGCGIDFTDECQTTPKMLFSADTVWKKLRIPISDLQLDQDGGMIDLTSLREINFGFSKIRFQEVGAVLEGTIYIDEIAFER